MYRYTINLDDECKEIVEEQAGTKISAFVRDAIKKSQLPKPEVTKLDVPTPKGRLVRL